MKTLFGFVSSYALVQPSAVCRCGAALIFDPRHPGRELGDWFVHPEIGGTLFGHTSAVMVSHQSLLSRVSA